MKKAILTLAALAICYISLAIPNGKYDANDGSYVLVNDVYIFLYIDGYSAGNFYIEKEYDDGRLILRSGSSQIDGCWYEKDGKTYLKIGKRTLVMTERY